MIALYFEAPPSAAQYRSLQLLWGCLDVQRTATNPKPARRYTPAQLEQLCAESETLDEMLVALRENAKAAEAAKADGAALRRISSRTYSNKLK